MPGNFFLTAIAGCILLCGCENNKTIDSEDANLSNDESVITRSLNPKTEKTESSEPDKSNTARSVILEDKQRKARGCFLQAGGRYWGESDACGYVYD